MDRLKDQYSIGDRIGVLPHHDVWMMGDRFGTVEKVGHVWVHVKMTVSGKVRKFTEHSIHNMNRDYSRIESVSVINGKI